MRVKKKGLFVYTLVWKLATIVTLEVFPLPSNLLIREIFTILGSPVFRMQYTKLGVAWR